MRKCNHLHRPIAVTSVPLGVLKRPEGIYYFQRLRLCPILRIHPRHRLRHMLCWIRDSWSHLPAPPREIIWFAVALGLRTSGSSYRPMENFWCAQWQPRMDFRETAWYQESINFLESIALQASLLHQHTTTVILSDFFLLPCHAVSPIVAPNL